MQRLLRRAYSWRSAGRAAHSCRRTLHVGWRCQASSQVPSGPPAGDTLPTFSFRVTAKQAAGKLRLDSFLASQIAADLATAPPAASTSQTMDVSRAKIQASIAAGLVLLNGRPAGKASQALRPGDCVVCSLPPPPPLQAVPEAIPLDIKYEDEHLLVINKPAGMVVHVAPGHYTGTLVNALLHHCALPPLDLAAAEPGGVAAAATASYDDLDDDADDGEEEDEDPAARNAERASSGAAASASRRREEATAPQLAGLCGGGGGGRILRPGIVHRLDKGTSGLLVVAKSEVALTRLQAQFKARTVDRLYVSITVGCPAQQRGRVEANIVRDPRDRKRMAAAPYGSGRGRTAASGYSVESRLAGGGAAVVRWKLDTGRTHQIRVHAKHIGHPLLGDETYGGVGPAVVAAVGRSFPTEQVRLSLEALGRPALHALTLGFTHPISGKRLAFEQPPPEDFQTALRLMGGDA